MKYEKHICVGPDGSNNTLLKDALNAGWVVIGGWRLNTGGLNVVLGREDKP